MRYIYQIVGSLILIISASGCVDDSLIEQNSGKPKDDMNIEEFSDGYSLSFNITVDQLGGDVLTRASNDLNDLWLSELENYVDPQEFRVLFFDENDNFLFESKTRWLTETDAKEGNRCWRVGVPIFQYLSDNFHQEGDDEGEEKEEGEVYNWEGIIEYMKAHPFKIAILANRPDQIKLPYINDYDDNLKGASRVPWDDDKFGKVGPFWGPYNSIMTDMRHDDNDKETKIMKVFDLHHCQYDPIIDAKNHSGEGGSGPYNHIIKEVWDSEVSSAEPVPYMGAMSSWLGDEKRYIYKDGGLATKEAFDEDQKKKESR